MQTSAVYITMHKKTMTKSGYRIISEGKANLLVPKEEKVSKKLPVFYNPLMELNRDLSIKILNALNKKDMQIALPLAGTGVRGVRFLIELKKSLIKAISFNDINKEAVKIIKKNLALNSRSINQITKTKIKIAISNKDANLFLLESFGFDYIDIDPFGSPNIFLNNSIIRLSRDGVLAVTATDTGALSGTFSDACKRKYWATPQRDETMHENGIRILIRKVQLIGADHEKALQPIYSYSKDHYFRIFFKCEKGRHKVDEILKLHGMFNNAGPLWLGQLWDTKLADKIKFDKFTQTIANESKISAIGFYNLPLICKKYRLEPRKQESIINEIIKLGYKAAVTHFAPNSIRSGIKECELVKILNNNNNNNNKD